MMKTSPASAEVSGAKLRLLIRQGVCFVATEIEEFGADLRSLALDAERHFGCPVTLGAIATFGRGFALRPHWDESDIIIIQVAGRKTWNISGQRHTGRMDVHRQTAPTEITREFTMEPGDLAVIPRGMWHRCHSEEDNLQFSVLLTRQTGADFI
jgi:oxalate decarboxylase/phosphoglucose isomerase-like protein (cupin superfamily)